MGTKSYTSREVRQLLEDLNRLTPKQQKLARALILMGLYATQSRDEDVQIELHDPGESGDLSLLLDNAFTPGGLPEQSRPRAMKVGNVIQISLPEPDQ